MSKEETIDKSQGDNWLAPFDRHLWELTYHLFIKFKTIVWFKYFPPNAPEKRDASLVWFISGDHPDFNRIRFYIFNEFKGEVNPGKEMDIKGEPFYSPGMSMDVLPFSGPQGYITREEVTKICHTAMYVHLMKYNFFARVGHFLEKHWVSGFAFLMGIGITIAYTKGLFDGLLQ
jgi:hypothetical protein